MMEILFYILVALAGLSLSVGIVFTIILLCDECDDSYD